MLPRVFLALLLLVTGVGCGCLRPDHGTLFYERDETEMRGATRQRAGTNKVGGSVTYDFR